MKVERQYRAKQLRNWRIYIMYGYIYKTTDIKTNKIYIGKHKATTFEGYNYLGSGKIITEIINKCKKENTPLTERFTIELIDTSESEEELDIKEREYIKIFNSNNHLIGYNLTEGGDGGNTINGKIKITNGIQEKWHLKDEPLPIGYHIGILNSKENHPLYNTHFHWYTNGISEIRVTDTDKIPDGYYLGRLPITEETREKIISNHHSVVTQKMRDTARKNWSGDNHPQKKNPKFGDKNSFYGKHHTNETKEKNRIAHMIKYKCPNCDYISNKSHITIHIREKHPELVESVSTIERID